MTSVKAWLAGGGPPPSQLARELESEDSATLHQHNSAQVSEVSTAESRCAAHQELPPDECDTISTVSSSKSSVNLSTISGSGLLFLRNYIKKKKVRDQNKQQLEQQDHEVEFQACFLGPKK